MEAGEACCVIAVFHVSVLELVKSGWCESHRLYTVLETRLGSEGRTVDILFYEWSMLPAPVCTQETGNPRIIKLQTGYLHSSNRRRQHD